MKTLKFCRDESGEGRKQEVREEVERIKNIIKNKRRAAVSVRLVGRADRK